MSETFQAQYLTAMFGLSGSTAVVTGGTSGLGAAVATGLASAGARVIVVGRDSARGAAIVDSINSAGGKATFESADLSRPEDISELADRVSRKHEVDILINAAGLCLTKPGLETTAQEWDGLFEINVRATFLLCQSFGARMVERGHGKIVNFASTDAVIGVPELSAYTASKGAVLQLTRSLAVEWAKHGVNVNCVAPTEFETPMTQPFLAQESYRKWVTDSIPIGRIGQPDEIVGAVLFLIAPCAAMMVGHNLLVDGGRTVI